MKTRMFYIGLFILVLCLLALPVETGLMLSCPGGQRMVHALLHGRVEEAFGYNPLLLCILPLVGWMSLGWLLPNLLIQYPRWFPKNLFADKFLFILLVVFFLWGIVRNVWNIV